MPLPQRKSPRLPGYDYTQSGAYFVTICTVQHQPRFGWIENDLMRLNDLGYLAQHCWREIPTHRPQIELGPFVVMPNHVHGIVIIHTDVKTPSVASADLEQRTEEVSSLQSTTAQRTGQIPSLRVGEEQPMGVLQAGSLGTIVGAYKAAVTRQARQQGLIDSPFWQERYHDHIIRNERGYQQISQYIEQNPARWRDDTFYIS